MPSGYPTPHSYIFLAQQMMEQVVPLAAQIEQASADDKTCR